MTPQLSPRDIELLSTYLDGQLTGSELAHLESRLQMDSGLRTTLDELRRTRTVLRSAPILKAPRNYTLKPGMVPMRRQPSRAYPILRLASVLASLLFVAALFSDLIGLGVPAQSPVTVFQPAAIQATDNLEAAEVTGQMLMQGKAPPESAAAPAQESLSAQAATETAPAPMLMQEMQAASPPATEAGVSPSTEAGDVQRLVPKTPPEEPETAIGEDEQPAIQATPIPGWWNSLRIIEVIALVCALATGMAAFIVHRNGSGS